MTCKGFAGQDPAQQVAVSPVCVSLSSPKHIPNSQGALLGLWLPGRDTLEDELRTFVGLASLVALAKREGDGSDKLAERVLHLTACMLKNQDPAICAAAGPMVAGDAPAAY
ncbi:hypothetical protein OEZ86_000001 [Tetradesmus obliquus]|nr:hypothetical protein OEZ86_000001 [Tetradesmus obliquus]